MTSIPLGKSDWLRTVAKEAAIPMVNRYYETNPTNLVEQVALLSRPGLRRMIFVGDGPVRQVYSQPGSFQDALFAISYDELYKIGTDGSSTYIGNGIGSDNIKAAPSMCATAALGDTPEYLWIADGRILWLYSENSKAHANLAVPGTIVAGDEVQFGSFYYRFTSGSVDAGSPAGTSANPWLVNLSTSNTNALSNLLNAIGEAGVSGTDYSTALTPNTQAIGVSSSGGSLYATAILPGTAGNAIATVVVSGTSMNFTTGTTMTGGGGTSLVQVEMPDDVGAVSVGYISGFVIVVVAQGDGENGRFYWIEPGATVIDPLNYATAERSPDPVLSVRVVGDQFWLLGTNSAEVWYVTGTPNLPFLRVQGRLFDRGVWGGTDAVINDTMFLVDNAGVVYAIQGGSPQRISDHSIEERIRNAQILAASEL